MNIPEILDAYNANLISEEEATKAIKTLIEQGTGA